ncbi:MAG: hypothetical protein U9Q73_00825 [Nanoarchaeota archaeon]|nr:hypothetical protein [Nanoarchaeota archaeon]
MEFKWHVLFGFIISCILVYFFEFSLLAGFVIFVASWMIDIDHYLWYAFETKDWNPIHAIRWYIQKVPKWFSLSFEERGKFKRGVFVFHSLFFWIILALLSFANVFFFWILIGIFIHMIADLIELKVMREKLYTKIFLCYVIRKNKNKRRLIEL